MVAQIDVGGLTDATRLGAGADPDRRGPVTGVLTRALHNETEGNPLFVYEIVRNLAEAGIRVSQAGAARAAAVRPARRRQAR